MKKTLSIILLLGLSVALLTGCSLFASEQPPAVDPVEPNPAEPGPDPTEPEQQEPEDDWPDLPEQRTLTVHREGTAEEFTAYRTKTASGLVIYLFPEFMLTQDGGYDILLPKPESGYLPVSLTMLNNGPGLTAEEALEAAKEYYPGVDFGTETYALEGLSGMQESAVAYGRLDEDWVICLGLSGENGSVSVWGQGDMETAEGLRVLLLSQIATIVQP